MDFWEWKREESPTSSVNNQIFAEHWRGRQIGALAVEIIDRTLARRAAEDLLDEVLPEWLPTLRPRAAARIARLMQREEPRKILVDRVAALVRRTA